MCVDAGIAVESHLDTPILTACYEAAEVEVESHGCDASIIMSPGPADPQSPC